MKVMKKIKKYVNIASAIILVTNIKNGIAFMDIELVDF